MALTRKQIGQRLRDIREAVGFTQAEVADRLGVHRPTISEIEAGRRAVTSEELFRFAELYATSIAALLAEPQPTVEAAVDVLFRRQRPDSPATRVAVSRFIGECRAERELEVLLGLPRRLDTRPGYTATPPRHLWDAVQQGQDIAAQERSRLSLGSEPVRNVLDLLERQGVRIGGVTGSDAAQLDGFYLETDELGPCIAVNPHDDTDRPGFRAVFTAAHEYAHWLLRDRQVEFFTFEPGTDDLQEVRANSFAAAFLVPRDGAYAYFKAVGLLVGNRIPQLSAGDVVRAMDHFGVSRLALLYRLLNLELITRDDFDDLRNFPVGETAQAMGIEFGKRQHVSERLPMLAMHAWRKGLISSGRAAELCGLDLGAFRDLVRDTGEEPDVAEDESFLGAAAVG